MKIETIGEQRERMLRENAQHKVPGRTLPRNCQWTGQDQPGCGAVKRRLRQQAALEAKRKPNEVTTIDAMATRTIERGELVTEDDTARNP